VFSGFLSLGRGDIMILFLLSHGHFIEVVDGVSFSHIDIMFGIGLTNVNEFLKSVLAESEGEFISWKGGLGVNAIIVLNLRIIIESDSKFSECFSEIVNLEVSI